MLLTLLALAAPVSAFAISDDALQSVSADPGPAALSVSTSLDSCGVLESQVVCKLDVSFNALPNAETYSATVTRADGTVVDYGGVGAGGTSLWVPYVGAGNYSVTITAYGEPETPNDRDGRGEVVAVGSSRGDHTGDSRIKQRDGEPRIDLADTQATSRGDAATTNADADGTVTTETEAPPAEPCPPADPPEPNPLPEDADPANNDEDADGVPDDQELAAAAAGTQMTVSPTVAPPPAGCTAP